MAKAQRPKQPRSVAFEITPYVVIDAIAFFIYGWAVYYNFTDKSGWSGLITGPALLAVAAMTIGCAVGLGILAAKTPSRKRKWSYSIGAFVTLLPVIVTSSYIAIGVSLENAASQRASTPITQEQAQRLVDTCQVESLLLENGGSMELNAFTPVLPGMDARPERRVFDGKYFDELVQLARRKDVESRCGFIPTYDIRRPQQPPTKKWITQAEAETIISKCLWNTQFIPDTRYTTSPPVPGKDDSGIFLEQHLSVWNDDTESIITLVRVDDATRAALQQKVNACGGRY